MIGLTPALRPGMIEAVIGATVGGYKIVSKVAAGGMGTVYKAEHTLIGKIAAVKVLKSELSHNTEIVNRFFNEAKATTSIKHPGIVEVFDFGYLESGEAFLIMEFLEGDTLANWLEARGRVSEGEAAMLMRSVCNALAVAHAKGIIHRDLKPDNIFMIPDPESALGERPKILDFGIAKLTEIGAATTATRTGAVMGTPTYMSPEQCKGAGVVDHRADIYSLGCILYELLCGRPPFTEMGAGEMIGAHLFMTPARPSEHNPTISAEGEALILALLEKDPNKRPQTAKELAARLTELAQQQLWITQGAPNGITSPELMPLGRPTPFPMTASTPIPGRASTSPVAVAMGDRRSAHAIGHSPTVSSAADHFGRAETAQPKPTTLSGAASQSFDVPHRSRKGLAIFASVGALIVGGIVAFAVVSSSGGDKPTAAKPAAGGESSTVDPTAGANTASTNNSNTGGANTAGTNNSNTGGANTAGTNAAGTSGANTAGTNTAGTSGANTAGTNASSTNASSTNASGANAAGTNTAGTSGANSSGTNTSGTHPTGTNAANTSGINAANTAGTNTAGTNAANTSSTNTAGTNTAGTKPNNSGTAGAKPNGKKPPTIKKPTTTPATTKPEKKPSLIETDI